jgi:hypothetical protein
MSEKPKTLRNSQAKGSQLDGTLKSLQRQKGSTEGEIACN